MVKVTIKLTGRKPMDDGHSVQQFTTAAAVAAVAPPAAAAAPPSNDGTTLVEGEEEIESDDGKSISSYNYSTDEDEEDEAEGPYSHLNHPLSLKKKKPSTSSDKETYPYACPSPNCRKAYKQPTGLRYHLQHGQCKTERRSSSPSLESTNMILAPLITSHAPGPFACPGVGCTKTYLQVAGLRYHLDKGKCGPTVVSNAPSPMNPYTMAGPAQSSSTTSSSSSHSTPPPTSLLSHPDSYQISFPSNTANEASPANIVPAPYATVSAASVPQHQPPASSSLPYATAATFTTQLSSSLLPFAPHDSVQCPTKTASPYRSSASPNNGRTTHSVSPIKDLKRKQIFGDLSQHDGSEELSMPSTSSGNHTQPVGTMMDGIISYRQQPSSSYHSPQTALDLSPNSTFGHQPSQSRSSRRQGGGASTTVNYRVTEKNYPISQGSSHKPVKHRQPKTEAAESSASLYQPPAPHQQQQSFHSHLPRPPYSYASLIAQAIMHKQDKKSSLYDIYEWIQENYAFYDKGDSGWQNSIRHNLSKYPVFYKVSKNNLPNGKGSLWSIIDSAQSQFRNGHFFVTRETFDRASVSIPQENELLPCWAPTRNYSAAAYANLSQAPTTSTIDPLLPISSSTSSSTIHPPAPPTSYDGLLSLQPAPKRRRRSSATITPGPTRQAGPAPTRISTRIKQQPLPSMEEPDSDIEDLFIDLENGGGASPQHRIPSPPHEAEKGKEEVAEYQYLESSISEDEDDVENDTVTPVFQLGFTSKFALRTSRVDIEDALQLNSKINDPVVKLEQGVGSPLQQPVVVTSTAVEDVGRLNHDEAKELEETLRRIRELESLMQGYV